MIKKSSPQHNSLHWDSRPPRFSQKTDQVLQVGPKRRAESIRIESQCGHELSLTEKGAESISQASRRGICKGSVVLGGLQGEPTETYIEVK